MADNESTELFLRQFVAIPGYGQLLGAEREHGNAEVKCLDWRSALIKYQMI